MVEPNIPLVTSMFDSIELQFKEAALIDYCYAIVNVLIREPALYELSEKTLTSYEFESRFDHVNHMAHWIRDIANVVYCHGSIIESKLLNLPMRRKQSLDTFNVDVNHSRVSSFDCLENIRSSLTHLYIAMVGCVSKRPHYDRVLDHYFQDVFLYLENYIKVVEYEQRESEEHIKRAGQTDDANNELPSKVVPGDSV